MEGLLVDEMGFASSQFLTAEWRHLAMLNFVIDPATIEPFVPQGTELDAWQGKTFVSLVAFLFLNTRVLGIAVPFHRNFEEVNLRLYVRRKVEGSWRRGVVFVKEVVPRRAIAWTARALYGENYVAAPMGHNIQSDGSHPGAARLVSYWWKIAGRENRVELSIEGEPRAIERESHEEVHHRALLGIHASQGARHRRIPSRPSKVACLDGDGGAS
jgi:uncharacterized protein